MLFFLFVVIVLIVLVVAAVILAGGNLSKIEELTEKAGEAAKSFIEWNFPKLANTEL
jgi:hypothetical protein